MAKTNGTAKKKERFLEFVRDGYSISGAAIKAGVGRQTVYTWRSKSDKFATEWDDAWESRGDWYEDQNREQAIAGNMAAILNGLKMHHRITEKQVTELTGKDGGAIEISDARSRLAELLAAQSSSDRANEDSGGAQ